MIYHEDAVASENCMRRQRIRPDPRCYTWVAVGVGGASLIGGVTGGLLGGKKSAPPAAPNYGQVAQQTLDAQTWLAPEQYADEAKYQPLYAGLQLNNLDQILNGSPGGPQNYNAPAGAMQSGWYDAGGNFVGAFVPGAPQPKGAVSYHKMGDMWSVTKTRQVAPTTGLLTQEQRANTSQRTGDINDVTNLGPQAAQAMLAADPYNATLLAKLNAQANTGLDAGSSLTADQTRAMQQQSRAAFAARGTDGDNSAVANELFSQFNLGNQLQQQRQAFAQSVLQNNQTVIGDPFQQILGRSSSAIPSAQQALVGAGPSLFNPQAGLGQANSNFQSAAVNAAGQPTGTQQAGSLLSGIGGLLGGLGSAGVFSGNSGSGGMADVPIHEVNG